jgi:hypothetical protein
MVNGTETSQLEAYIRESLSDQQDGQNEAPRGAQQQG